MDQMFCSLCKNVKKAQPLDEKDLAFGKYVKLIRALGFSKHTEKLGVCDSCMDRYYKIRAGHQKKMITYGTMGVVLGFAYLYLTSNILIALIVVLFMMGLSLFSYCPPLKSKD